MCGVCPTMGTQQNTQTEGYRITVLTRWVHFGKRTTLTYASPRYMVILGDRRNSSTNPKLYCIFLDVNFYQEAPETHNTRETKAGGLRI